jgi:hypothetical protein
VNAEAKFKIQKSKFKGSSKLKADEGAKRRGLRQSSGAVDRERCTDGKRQRTAAVQGRFARTAAKVRHRGIQIIDALKVTTLNQDLIQ